MKDRLYEGFRKYYGDSNGAELFFSPGRVNLIGEHTDYNGGHVFPCALTMGTYALVRKRGDNKMNFVSLNFNNAEVTTVELPELSYQKKNGWANYLIGVVWAFLGKGYKIDKGFDLAMLGNIPSGAGLSSSASIEVLMGTALKYLYDIDIDMVEIAKIGQTSENQFNGMNCGIMDQFAVAMGKKDNAIFLDTADLSYEYAPVKLKDAKVLITNSHVKHSLVDSAYNDRRNESTAALKALQTKLNISGLGDLTEEEFEENQYLITDEVQRKRAKHAVYENQRTIKAVNALKNNDIETFGKLMNASHISLRDDYEVSCPEVDKLVEIAWNIPGVIGSRITGGGFGGCTVSIVKNDAIENFRKEVISKYKEATGIDAEIYEAEIGDGAGRIQ
ncbi:galactokinase [Catonella massiliensis]|uniref:Galactokinase n=1 Tax=Catonella massiliensis TaxID=2799636 RepID=A0ABS1IZJ0_9FIRM|nr:galactokinase [Catonella massiliensis]MBK5897320.1 galactokinase [Catonella massiliensis]